MLPRRSPSASRLMRPRTSSMPPSCVSSGCTATHYAFRRGALLLGLLLQYQSLGMYPTSTTTTSPFPHGHLVSKKHLWWAFACVDCCDGRVLFSSKMVYNEFVVCDPTAFCWSKESESESLTKVSGMPRDWTRWTCGSRCQAYQGIGRDGLADPGVGRVGGSGESESWIQA